MFYSQTLLAKKGLLSKVWLAAHYNNNTKLNKQQIANTDIKTLIASVAKPQEALSLRVSAHLLLGLSRIFQRQVQYLFIESNSALVKIRAVRSLERGRRESAVLAARETRGRRRCGRPHACPAFSTTPFGACASCDLCAHSPASRPPALILPSRILVPRRLSSRAARAARPPSAATLMRPRRACAAMSTWRTLA